jgi:outer membrane protein assembly factor BamD
MLKKYFSLLLLIFIVASCGSNRPKANLSADERLAYAMKIFEKGDYLDARKEFRVIVLNYPGHQIVDRAQFHLAECHFKMKEYILAIAEYQKLIRMLPNSEYVDDAQYKIGLSNFELSPKYSLDQNYTTRAIEELQKFTEDYPDSDYKEKATKLMLQCREKLAKKDYKNAELYRKIGDYDAAVVYYEGVLTDYYDTKFAEDAQYWIAECLRRDHEYAKAISEFEKYLEKYPDGQKKQSVKSLLKKARAEKKVVEEREDQKTELTG